MPPPASKTYSIRLEPMPRGGVRVEVPFDPDQIWGAKREHRVSGTAGGMTVRGSVVRDEAGWSFSLGPAWLRDGPVGPGDLVEVTIAPEGPQRADLADDFRRALEENPAAGAFFDSLAQFYRKAYVRWIEATKGRPEVRAERVAAVVALLSQGVKERPKP